VAARGPNVVRDIGIRLAWTYIGVNAQLGDRLRGTQLEVLRTEPEDPIGQVEPSIDRGVSGESAQDR
jgi:hypothetical protein